VLINGKIINRPIRITPSVGELAITTPSNSYLFAMDYDSSGYLLYTGNFMRDGYGDLQYVGESNQCLRLSPDFKLQVLRPLLGDDGKNFQHIDEYEQLLRKL